MKQLTMSFTFLLGTFLLFQCSSPQTANDNSTKSSFSSKEETAYFVWEGGQYVARELDEEPEFSEGELAFLKRVYRKMKYPAEAREKGVGGTVLITVFLDEKGQLENAVLSKGIGYGCDEEALKAIQHASQNGFTPAIYQGKAVRVKFDLPVKFKLV